MKVVSYVNIEISATKDKQILFISIRSLKMMEKYSSDYSYYGNVYRKSADGNDILVEENAMLEYYDETFKFAFLSDAMAYIFSLAYDKEDDNKVAENVLNSKMFSCDRNTTNNGDVYVDPESIRVNMKYPELKVLIDNLNNPKKRKGKK